jgi:hypothetical protein
VVSPLYSGELNDNSVGKHQVLLSSFSLRRSLHVLLFYSSVKTFYFGVCLGPIGCDFTVYNTTIGKVCTKLSGGELWSIVSNNFVRDSMGCKCGLHAFYDSCGRSTLHNMYFWPTGAGIYHEKKTFSTGKRSTQISM